MKLLLWTVLALCVLANVFLNFLVGDDAFRTALSILSGIGIGVLACGAELYLRRERRED
ncbi:MULTISPECIES: hypothetical protein [unclassified Streptomyces]|uniref:hypothetical protein n=1 Tax=unclassified Streptomyces TaxID=2593676 RepID=UPI002DDC862E|nr:MULTISPECIES: hypothetical protein [unclassified Streptomyces]WSA90255.1 hypothetical protein OIE63_00945 [Streptomyces sp. NBC_01795]WSB74481.1 hypothetical protein OHB04_00940 [Streptomyces sp. NBC_01775]WSS45881.1 hypothetical protein OG220_38715 [Streptomyces sp. NBC_01187]